MIKNTCEKHTLRKCDLIIEIDTEDHMNIKHCTWENLTETYSICDESHMSLCQLKI